MIEERTAVLFDLDGVVFDTESQYSQVWEEINHKHVPEIRNLSNKIKGTSLQDIFDRYFAGKTEMQREIVSELNDFEADMKFEYIAGFQMFLDVLKKNGIKTAIVTSSNDEKMKSVYKNYPYFKSQFDTIVSADKITKSKPDPECYLLAAEELGCKPEDCFVFEDSFNGLKAGKNAGMKVIGLATTNSADSIRGYSDLVINDFTEMTFTKLLDTKYSSSSSDSE